MTAAPPPVDLGDRLAVAVDMKRLRASVRFDVASQVAETVARVELALEGSDGCPTFDLRQTIEAASFDGVVLPPEAMAHVDMGAGEQARMRVLDVNCLAGSEHELEVSYRLGTPAATGSLPLEWSGPGDGVSWDLWMSDLEPGRYLEMWFPANLCHDQLEVEISVEVAGTRRPHLLLANGELVEHKPGASWTVRYPGTYTSLSPLLVLVPADQVEQRHGTVLAAG